MRFPVLFAKSGGGAPAPLRVPVGVLAVTTIGFPAAIAGLGWIEEVLVPD